MTELERILEAYQNVDFPRQKAAIASVVKLVGSGYRRPGARMLITQNARWTGSVSGGCLEGNILRRARRVMENGVPDLVRYDTMNDDENSLGIGLGCHGVIDILIERADESSQIFSLLTLATKQESPSALVTVFRVEGNIPVSVGERLLLTREEFRHTLQETAVLSQFLSLSETSLLRKRSLNHVISLPDGECEVFVEYIRPTVHCIIFGSGFDSAPVASLAKSVGWRVTVTDDCAAKAFPLRAPSADSVCLIASDAILDSLDINEESVAVVMSHNYHYDRSVVRQLLGSKIRYIGLLGPRKRFEKMLADFANEGIFPNEQDLQKIHNPVGIHIGAETPEEIAVSIIAEISAVLNDADATFLRNKSGSIHERNE